MFRPQQEYIINNYSPKWRWIVEVFFSYFWRARRNLCYQGKWLLKSMLKSSTYWSYSSCQLQNWTSWRISRSCLIKMSSSNDLFKTNRILWMEKGWFILILLWIKQENMKKRNFGEELVCQVKSCPCLCCFSIKTEDYRKVYYYYFSWKWPFLVILWFCALFSMS